MKTMNLPGFTAASSLGKSTISYGQFGTVNFRRASSLIQPQLRISDPQFLQLYGGGGGGIDFDVPTPVDLGDPNPAVSRHRACAMCRSRCMHLPLSRRQDCIDDCPCD
jgi:hypothetical protein